MQVGVSVAQPPCGYVCVCVICGQWEWWGRNHRLEVEVKVKEAGKMQIIKEPVYQEIELYTSGQLAYPSKVASNICFPSTMSPDLYQTFSCLKVVGVKVLPLTVSLVIRRIAETWEEFDHCRWKFSLFSNFQLYASSSLPEDGFNFLHRTSSQSDTVLVSQGCHNRMSQTERFKWTKIYCLMFLEAGSPK